MKEGRVKMISLNKNFQAGGIFFGRPGEELAPHLSACLPVGQTGNAQAGLMRGWVGAEVSSKGKNEGREFQC